MGMYLATAVFYATLFGKRPEGLPYMPADSLSDDAAYEFMRESWQMSTAERDMLQRIAWDTVQEYQAQQGAAQ